MKRFLKFFCLMLVLILLLSTALLLVGCKESDPQDEKPPLSKTAVYTITLKDYKGNAPTDPMLVELFQNGTSLSMKKVGEDGTVSFELDRGDYTFVPRASGGGIYYDENECTLTAEKTAAQVTLYAASEQKAPIFVHHEEEYFEYQAALVGEGATYVKIDRTDRAYYLFTPSRGGIYQISCTGGDEVNIGHYGDANVVLRENVAVVENNSYTFEIMDSSVSASGGGTMRMVIGLSSTTAKDAILTIERIGDPTPVLPWTMLSPKQLPHDYIRSDVLNHKLINISVIDPTVKVVFNDADGYYHYGTETGPIVYVRITSDSPYIRSFTEVCEAANMCRFYYDDDGNIIKKEGYNSLIMEYAEICDNNGVCPLTEEMIYVLKNNGEHMGWWDFREGGNNIFTYTLDDKATGITEETLIKENAWMFACCYVEEYAYGSEKAPVSLTPSDSLTYSAIIPESGVLYFKVSSGTVLTVEQATGLTLTYGGVEYTADAQGKIKIVLDGDATTLVAKASQETTFTFTYRLSKQGN